MSESKILKEKSWEYKDGTLKITLANNDSEIEWNKNVYDELVVTFIYTDAEADVSALQIATNATITVYNTGTTYPAPEQVITVGTEEPNKLITVKLTVT